MTPQQQHSEKLGAHLVKALRRRHISAVCCHDCNSPDSICSYIHILRNSRNEGRHCVVLVGEPLGY